MKRIRQVVLLILLLLISIGGVFVICAVFFLVPADKVQPPLSEPSFLVFIFMVSCCLLSAVHKLNYYRTLLSKYETNINILDSNELDELENSAPGRSWIQNTLYIVYFFFGLCLIGSCVYLLDLIDYDFRSEFNNSIRWEQLVLIIGLFLLGVTVLYDAVLTRPWKNN